MNFQQGNNRANFNWYLRQDWEKSFPNLTDDWTHYQILGDGNELAIVDVLNLSQALDVIEENYNKHKIILVHRAKVNVKDGGFTCQETFNFYISSIDSTNGILSTLNSGYNDKYLDKRHKSKRYSTIRKLSLFIAISLTLIDFFWGSTLNNIEFYQSWSKIITYFSFGTYFVVYFFEGRLNKNN